MLDSLQDSREDFLDAFTEQICEIFLECLYAPSRFWQLGPRIRFEELPFTFLTLFRADVVLYLFGIPISYDKPTMVQVLLLILGE